MRWKKKIAFVIVMRIVFWNWIFPMLFLCHLGKKMRGRTIVLILIFLIGKMIGFVVVVSAVFVVFVFYFQHWQVVGVRLYQMFDVQLS